MNTITKSISFPNLYFYYVYRYNVFNNKLIGIIIYSLGYYNDIMS